MYFVGKELGVLQQVTRYFHRKAILDGKVLLDQPGGADPRFALERILQKRTEILLRKHLLVATNMDVVN